jgi:hypothetical protein
MRSVTVVLCLLVSSIAPSTAWAQAVADPGAPTSQQAASGPVAASASDDQAAPIYSGPSQRRDGFWAPFREVPRDVLRFASLDAVTVLGTGAAAAAGLHRWDDNGMAHAQQRMQARHYRVGNVGGNFYFQMGGAFGLYAVARMTESSRSAALGADLLRAQILTQGLVQAGKNTTRRARPDGSNHYSLPSGHAATTFATASVLQRHFGWAVGIPAYAFGAYVGAARMSANRHHLSDVVMGAAVGIAAGRSVTVGRGKARFAMGVAPTSGGAAVTLSR